MPFLGKDWRSSGEQWIRTEHGWERTRVLECILDNLNIGLNEEKVRKKLYNKKSKTTSGSGRHKASSKRLDSVNDDDEMEEAAAEEDDDRMNSIDEEERAEEEESDEGWNYVYDELSLLSDDEDEEENQVEEEEDEPSREMVRRSSSTARGSKSSVFMMRSRSASQSIKSRQPHIIYWEVDAVNRENNAPKATISEVLNALDMPGAVKDIKRFNYVCRLVQIIINEKLNQLSGNAQRTLFMIVKHMLIQVIKSQENLNVMRKLLHDFKKKIQDSIYFYFYYIGSQKLCDRHLATIAKWQEILENPNHHRKLKRLHHSTTTTIRKASSPPSSSLSSSSSSADSSSDVIATNEPEDNENNKENESQSPSPPSLSSSPFESIPIDCKLEIMRRLNCGLDLVNLAKCSRNLNDLVSSELKIWKNLCQFHFQQASINSFVNRLQKNGSAGESVASSIGSGHSSGHESSPPVDNDLDWKQIYFRLKRRYGHREIYTDMVHKCCHCKSLFWKEIGHPCVIMESLAYPDSLEFRSEPITPKKLIELLLK